MFKKWICLMLALALCSAPLTLAVADELEIEEDFEIEAVSDDLDVDETVAAADIDWFDFEGEDEAAADLAEIIEPGYRRVKADDTRVFSDIDLSDAIARLDADGAVLVLEAIDGRLRVAFDSELGIVTGYVREKDLAELADDEAEELKKQLIKAGSALYPSDMGDLPLPAPDCDFIEATAQAATVQSNALPDEEGSAESNSGPSLTLSYNTLTIGIKEKCSILTATLGEANSNDTVTWSTSKKSVAKVNSKTGVITGVKAGTVTITAKAGSLKKTCKVTVAKAPKKVSLDQKKLILSVGQTQALKAKLPSKTGSTLTYTSDNKKAAKVDKHSGLITAVAPGSATITVKTFNKKTATCKVTVVDAPEQVFLPETFSVSEKEHKTISASVVGKNNAASAANYTYSVKNGTGKATVDSETGEVVGVRAGTATIYVTTHNGVSTHLSGGEEVQTACQVTILPGPAEISLAAKTVTIGLKQKFALNPVILTADGQVLEGAKFTVSTSKKKYATVNDQGVIKGVKKGKATITVTAFNGVKATCKVKVVKAPKKVSLKISKSTIGVGETTRVKPSFPSGTMASCTYSSSDKSVATVDSEGNVTGVSEGSAVIKVRTHNSKTAKVTVKVSRNPRIIYLNADYDSIVEDSDGDYLSLFTKTMNPGDTFKIKCDSEYGIQGADFSFETDDDDVADVSASGTVTAYEPGVANITVNSSTGTTAILRVTVSGKVSEKIAFTASEPTVKAGNTVAAPGLKGTNISAGTLSKAVYKSSNKKVFTVAWDDDENRWLLTGVKAGTATLTATAGSAKAQTQVTVVEAGKTSHIFFEDERVYMTVGESFIPRVLDDFDAQVEAELASSKSAVASVSEKGAVTAEAEGTAVITATLGKLTAKLTVVVKNSDDKVTLDAKSLKMGTGEHHALKVKVNGNGASTKLTFKSSKTKVATVTSAGVIIARSAGKTTITVTTAGGATATCAVTVSAAPTALHVSPSSVRQRLKTGGVQLTWSFGSDDEVGSVSFSSSNSKVASVDDEGYVSFNAAGTAKISVVTGNGLSATVPVTVLPNQEKANKTEYRLFAAYSYHDDLPFTKRNGTTVASVFGKSSIGGQAYSTKVMGNPSKSSLLNGISSFFDDTDDNDVSIVYLCSHGHNDKSSYSNYFMSLKGYNSKHPDSDYYMTSKEIFSRIQGIRGSVVLILDSCYSGTFIEDMKSRLDAEGGRIAVLTAASNTRATYYNKKSGSVDFFTFFLMQGLGYNEQKGWWNKNAKGKQGSYPGYLAADKNGDGNGFVTLNEFYSFAANSINANIKSYMKKSWYWGDKKKVQKTRFYAGNLKNLVIYQAR